VTFDIDANGILTVTAKDKVTGKAQSIKITGSTGLTKEEIERMKKEAEEHAKEDQAERERIEARNKADGMIYTAEKSLKDVGDKAPKEVKEEVEKKIKELKEILEKGSREELESKTKELSDSLQKICQYMYQQQGKANASPDGDKKKTNNDKKVEEGEVVN